MLLEKTQDLSREVRCNPPEDPVFGRGRCEVAGCGRSAWARDLCSAHHQRRVSHGKPDLGEFKAGAAAVAVRAGSKNVDGFDLSALAVGPRLEVAYVLQCRHDDRTVRVPPSTVRHLVALLADSGAGSLLDRPLEDWLDEVRSHRRKHPSPVIGLIGYAYRRLSDLGGIDIEAEYASDLWVASRLGIKVTRSPAQRRFDPSGVGSGNSRNGFTPKRLHTDAGTVDLEVPRDRQGSFEPRIVAKGQSRLDGFDDRIVALYARGMTVRDVQAHLQEIYGVEVSHDLISRVTDGVWEELEAWRSRPLDSVYPVVFIDALMIKIETAM